MLGCPFFWMIKSQLWSSNLYACLSWCCKMVCLYISCLQTDFGLIWMCQKHFMANLQGCIWVFSKHSYKIEDSLILIYWLHFEGNLLEYLVHYLHISCFQGWTLYEILRYAPQHNWTAYEEILKTNPVFAKMVISGVVYSVGDWIAQVSSSI